MRPLSAAWCRSARAHNRESVEPRAAGRAPLLWNRRFSGGGCGGRAGCGERAGGWAMGAGKRVRGRGWAGSARACGRLGRACGRLGVRKTRGAGCGWVRARRAGAKRLSGTVGRRPCRAGANRISMSGSIQKEPTRRSAQTVMGRGAFAKRADGDGSEEGADKDGGACGEHGAADGATRSRRVVGGGAQGVERRVTDRVRVEVAAGRGTPALPIPANMMQTVMDKKLRFLRFFGLKELSACALRPTSEQSAWSKAGEVSLSSNVNREAVRFCPELADRSARPGSARAGSARRARPHR